MAVMHVPPIVAQSVVFVLDGSCLQSRHIESENIIGCDEGYGHGAGK
jgi:hypothetical protein